jgi:hypothetical protein
MSPAKLAAVAIAAALALSACGSTSVHPTSPASGRAVGRGKVDDPRLAKADRVKCLQDDHLPVREVGQTDLQIGAPPAGPRVVFTPSPGSAQGMQIAGQAQGAEVIGSALLYPDRGSDTELSQIETCLTKGVSG